MQIIFLPENKSVTMNDRESVLAAAAKASIFIEAACAGRGTCGKCKIKVLSGSVSEISNEERKYLTKEEIEAGIRLACKVYAKGDVTVELLVKGEEYKKNVRKSITTTFPEEFIAVYKEEKDKEEKDKEEKDKKEKDKKEKDNKRYGIAFDIGTTSVVGMLWDRMTCSEMGSIAKMNPQRSYGADVISRIQYSLKSEENSLNIQAKVIQCLESIMAELLEKSKISYEELNNIVVVGNTTMSHLFLGVPVNGLAKSPFLPGFEGMVRRSASDFFHKVSNKTKLLVLPNIGGHVGSDITAGILAKGLDGKLKNRITVFIDIGTNGEIVLQYEEKMYACSTAAGPAFEGASIHAGMRASDGAIEGVDISCQNINLKVIGDKTPIGICGSGLIDAIAKLLEVGIIDETGRILDKKTLQENKLANELFDRILETDRGNDFILYCDKNKKDDILITQKDIREVQMAKAAIYSGMITMLKKVGAEAKDIDELIIAGAFGNYINKESAKRIGLLPNILHEKITMAGNTASLGASMVLLSGEYERRAEKLIKKIEHIELAGDSDFMDVYIEAMNFPNM